MVLLDDDPRYDDCPDKPGYAYDPNNPNYYDEDGWHHFYWDHRFHRDGRELIGMGGPTHYGRTLGRTINQLNAYVGNRVKELREERADLERRLNEGVLSRMWRFLLRKNNGKRG